jgi:hypothetical protein
MSSDADDSALVLLDAEELAEGGIARAYEKLLPRLRQYVPRPAPIEELFDNDAPLYAVRYAGRELLIYAPDLDNHEGRSWGRATHVLFTIVNDQLDDSVYRFFATNAGNDLVGMFLTQGDAESRRAALARRLDWPYLPDDTHPWYGQPH